MFMAWPESSSVHRCDLGLFRYRRYNPSDRHLLNRWLQSRFRFSSFLKQCWHSLYLKPYLWLCHSQNSNLP